MYSCTNAIFERNNKLFIFSSDNLLQSLKAMNAHQIHVDQIVDAAL